MAIPLATTRISVLRQAQVHQDGEPYQNAVYSVIATDIRAVIALSPNLRGEEAMRGGERSTKKSRLVCDVCDLKYLDRVVDTVTEAVWQVEYVHERIGLGQDHLTVGLIAITGRL